jgi:hypothetical protein
MAEINFKTFLNRRILIDLCKMPIEKKVLEVSPSGDYVKVENQNGHKEWLETKNIEVLEVLEEVIEGKPVKDLAEWVKKPTKEGIAIPWQEPNIYPPYKIGDQTYPGGPHILEGHEYIKIKYTDKTA